MSPEHVPGKQGQGGLWKTSSKVSSQGKPTTQPVLKQGEKLRTLMAVPDASTFGFSHAAAPSRAQVAVQQNKRTTYRSIPPVGCELGSNTKPVLTSELSPGKKERAFTSWASAKKHQVH